MSHSAGNLSSNPARNPQKTLKFCNRFHFLFSPTVPSPTWNDRGGFVPRCFVQTIPRNPKKPAICTLFAFLVYALGTVPLNTRNYQVQVVQQPEQQPGHQRHCGREELVYQSYEGARSQKPIRSAQVRQIPIRENPSDLPYTCPPWHRPRTPRSSRGRWQVCGRCNGPYANSHPLTAFFFPDPLSPIPYPLSPFPSS